MPVRPYESPWAELAIAFGLVPASDQEDRLRWLFRAAEVWEEGGGDVARAFDVLARALEIAPDSSEARDRIFRLAKQHGEWDRLAELYQTAAEEAPSAPAAAALLLEVARLRAEQGRWLDAESLYRRVLSMRPDDALARDRLEAFYRSEGRWVDLVASLEERTDPRLGAAAPPAQRPALLRELANIYRHQLGRNRDAIDALERLDAQSPNDLDVLEELADLYGLIGRWSKVISVLTRIAEIAEGSDRAKNALRVVGRIYERELELPDRAIEAYAQVAREWPDDQDAYESLDRLYEHHGRWSELAEVLRRRAALVRDAGESAALWRRRAHVLLEKQDAADEAVTSLRQARSLFPQDNQLAEELVHALVMAGREREAVSILEGRVEALENDPNAPAGEVAALLIRLAGLRAERLSDAEEAHRLLEQALSLVPDHPTALAALARLAEANEDPRSFAEAKLRAAEALQDVDAVVESLLAAGIALRDKCRDIEGARAAFERVLALRPFHADATWALAGLVEQEGDVEKASALLEARLQGANLEPAERAQVLTQLAALSRQGGVDADAERRLDEALRVLPDHLPAVFARANLLAMREDWTGLAEFLEQVGPNLADKSADARAEMERRRALAYQHLGRHDEAYQTLLEADRLQRGNLLIKLALGENRYHARRWREAALHLSALSGHRQAEMYPAEVAEGLYHAAVAEIRALRPEQAEPLYERAIELKPNYVPALRALAELAMERGDYRRAADLLTQQAQATEDANERTRLYEALSDLASTTLRDPERARACLEAAVKAAVPLEGKHVPLLEKLLAFQEANGEQLGIGKTCELLASFAPDGAARASRLKRAAECYLAAGRPERAKAAAQRALQADPYDLAAVNIASELALADGEFEQVAAMLGRALSKRSENTHDEPTRHAQLWSRLAEARQQRGDEKGAIGAYLNAVKLAPDSDASMVSRRRLIALWAHEGERQEERLEYKRVLAAHTLVLQDIVDYADELISAQRNDGGVAVLELAETLGHAPGREQTEFLRAHPARAIARDEAYRGIIDEAEARSLLGDAEDLPMHTLLEQLWEAAPLLWSDVAGALDRVGAGDAERIAHTSELEAATMFSCIARALHAPATVLYRRTAAEAPDIQVVCASPPLVIFGPRLANRAAQRPSDLELRFLFGRAAELTRPARVIATGQSGEAFAQLLAALVRVFSHGAAGSTPHFEEDEQLRKALPVKVRSRLTELLAHGKQNLDADNYLTACERAADRAGLLIAGDISLAERLARSLGASGSTRHLAELVLRPGYLETRGRLGIGAVG
jgi:tetratricopeptide (TPR) repeat protein